MIEEAEVVKTIKLQLVAETETFRSLDGQSKICNWLYNQLLEKANHLKQQFIQSKDPKSAKILYTQRGLRNQIPLLKKDHHFLKAVHSSPLKNTALRLSQAIQAHQNSKKGKRAGNEMGWPKFRSWQASWFSLLYDEPNKGFKLNRDQLTLSLGGRISVCFTLKDHHLLKGQTLRNLRIVKQATHYYAIFTVLAKHPAKKPIKRIIAFDPNHKNMAHGVDTEGKSIEIKAPNWLKVYDKRFDELKSKRDRCLKKSQKQIIKDPQGNPVKERFIPSKRWRKYQNTLDKARHKRQEQTKTYVYTLAHEICKHYDAVGIGDYTPKGEGTTTAMRRAMNNRSLNRRFKQALEWVAAKSGKRFTEYDEKGTTRTCNHCHEILSEGLHPSIRKWGCPKCHTVHLRDENAAINGLKKILRDLENKCETLVSQVPCSGLFQIVERWAWCVLPSGVRRTLRGQSGEQSQAPGNEIGSLVASGHKLAY
jgi:putative transposase